MANNDRATGHQRIDHTFNNELLSYDAGIHYQPCIKLAFYFNKLPDVSYEHFYKHWASVHADLTVAAKSFSVHKIKRYVQTHQTPEQKERLRKLGLKVLEFDGCSILWVSSWEEYEKFLHSPEYAGLGADCAHFMDASSITVYAGHDMIAFGKAIPDVDDQDGITEYPHPQ